MIGLDTYPDDNDFYWTIGSIFTQGLFPYGNEQNFCSNSAFFITYPYYEHTLSVTYLFS